MSLTDIKRPFTDCGLPIIRFEAYNGCGDDVGGNFFGDGEVIGSSTGAVPFNFTQVTNLTGFITDLPRAITRQISLNCRTQKAQSFVPYMLQGADAYPPWKMREIEDMLHAEHILVDGQEVQYSGGTPFTAIGKNPCEAIYRLNVNLQECDVWNIYGCGDDCRDKDTYFAIPDTHISDDYFNSNGLKVANTYPQLLQYFSAQPGVTDVVDMPVGGLGIRRDFYKVFKVAGAVRENYIYFDNPTDNRNKVYGAKLDRAAPAYPLLENGIDNTSCPKVVIGTPTVEEITCTGLVIGTPLLEDMSCTVSGSGDWGTNGENGITATGTVLTLTLNLKNTGIRQPGTPVGLIYSGNISLPDNCAVPTDVPAAATITVLELNGAVLGTDKYSFGDGTNNITFSPCLSEGDYIKVYYGPPVTPPIIGGITVALISGECLPVSAVYLTNHNNATVPLGVTIIINTDGRIQWAGGITSADATAGYISITGIIFNI